MKPTQHIALGTAGALALVPIFGLGSLAFCSAAVLVDGDHYVDYILRNRFTDFDIRRAVRWNEMVFHEAKSGPFLSVEILHTVEALSIVGFVALITGPLGQAAFWGMVFHIVLDLIYLQRHRLLSKRAHSIIEFAIRWNLNKRRGTNLESPYRSASEALMEEFRRINNATPTRKN